MRALFSSTANDENVARQQLIEAALAHVLGGTKSKTEAAYNRAIQFTARTALMQWWEDRVEGVCATYTAARGVLPIFPKVTI